MEDNLRRHSNVFITWSGERSRVVAEALRDWLPKVIQASKPWMSETDIEKGSRGLGELGNALEGIKVGIVCLTPENQNAPWVLFEAGALSKTIDDKTRLCTYLLGGLRPHDVRSPLGMFQATRADKEDTRKLVHSVNNVVSDEPVPEKNLNDVFNAMWPELAKMLATLPEPTEAVAANRSVEDIVAELLELVRADTNRRKKTDYLDEFLPIFNDLLPFLPTLREEIARAIRQFVSAPTRGRTTDALPERGSATPSSVFPYKLPEDPKKGDS